VHPELDMADTLSQIHGIAPSASVRAPAWNEIAPALAAQFEGAIAVGHGIENDLRFLTAAYGRNGEGSSPVLAAIDTLVLARRAVATSRYTLRALTSELSLPPRQWHRALEDARGVRELFRRIVPEFGARCAADLAQVRVGQRGAIEVRDQIAERLAALGASREPCTLIVRARGHGPTPITGTVERWQSPHVWMTLQGGGLRVLRADRVLRIESVAK
jgi:DNA polymerase III epsilon subunit-like protein